ncbi:predicted protein [Streptomyces viridosporus ATCC 14672]|uniref:Predicted protein n=1 Tax=Streptomyces viridosporus (strain ATCC 14672 / DSM 40746 / JCM 4963 / KCTC 9882 / NRRL B-12104 / FH 1290) TaxID=566461 RepID=D6A727_STRV1|nr:predicted protein [Streptomyces viridosporus ATCC 14672]
MEAGTTAGYPRNNRRSAQRTLGITKGPAARDRSLSDKGSGPDDTGDAQPG